MSTSPLSKSLQLAIRKAVESSTHLLGHLVDSSDNFVEASDLTLELAYHTGELALRQCFVEHLQGRLLPGQPRGYYKTLELHILGDQTLALLVKRSDLNMSDLSDRVAAETMYIIFGSLFNRIDRRPLQDTFDCLFQPIIASANAAYVAYNEKKANHPTKRRQVQAEESGRFIKCSASPEYSSIFLINISSRMSKSWRSIAREACGNLPGSGPEDHKRRICHLGRKP
ncbi:hypothetical protein K438DRAFT_1734378 [Mycena galopus ATCC 62051]|nr:hypothetical protein K438DRAFT_1734378 [Mycena galopus ATCC 62051]